MYDRFTCKMRIRRGGRPQTRRQSSRGVIEVAAGPRSRTTARRASRRQLLAEGKHDAAGAAEEPTVTCSAFFTTRGGGEAMVTRDRVRRWGLNKLGGGGGPPVSWGRWVRQQRLFSLLLLLPVLAAACLSSSTALFPTLSPGLTTNISTSFA